MGYSVSTNVPYGNACDIETGVDEGEPSIRFAADPHGGPETLWFCFRVTAFGAVPSGGNLHLVLRHPSTMLGMNMRFAGKLRLAIRCDDGPWLRSQPGAGTMMPDGRGEIFWRVSAPRRWLDVAFCYPYGRGELNKLLADCGIALRGDTIGVSQGGRPISRLSNSPGEPGSHRPGVYCIARQHSGETPGSWVLDGLLRALAELGRRAPLVWAVPLANIDGVERGDYGKDNFPIDLNRAWGNPPMRHETLVIRRDIELWRLRCRPMLLLDLHAPGGHESDGSYVYLPKSGVTAAMSAAATGWASRFQRALGPMASPNFARTANYPSRWELPTVTRYCMENNVCCALSVETSYQSAGSTVLTPESYGEIGRRLAAVLSAPP
jgi:hypothetical protein